MAVKRLLNIAFSFFICCVLYSLFSPSTYAFSGTGGGTSGNPYEIATCSQLQEINSNLGAYYQINNDIDCNGVSFSPIGTSGGDFTGTLNHFILNSL